MVISLDIVAAVATDQVPLYVRLNADNARLLEQAAAACGCSKRRLIEDAVEQHLSDTGLVVGRVALREDAPDVLTAGEAAALLRIDTDQLLAAAERGEVPGRRIGEQWRFARPALLDWLSTLA
jgi:excisionase family DNA binding protein